MTEAPEDALSTGRLGLAGRMAVNSTVQIVGSAFGAFFGFLVFIAIARSLGPSAYGNFATATVFLAVPVVLADVGLSAVVVREISARPDRTAAAMGASLPLRLALSVLFVGLALGAAFLLPFNGATRFLIVIGSIGALFTLLALSLAPVFQAKLKMHWVALANVAGRAAALAATLAFLAAGLGLNAVMTATVVGFGLTLLVSAFGVRRIVHFRPHVDVAYWRTLLRESLTMGAAVGLSQLILRVDVIVLALLTTSEEVGWYAAAYKFIEYSGLIANGIAFSLFPVLARFAVVDEERFSAFLQRSLDLMVVLAAPIAVVGVLLAPTIIDLTAGTDFENGAVALSLLAPSLLAGFMGTSYWIALISAGQERALLGIAAGLLAANIAANLAVIPFFGYKGAAVVTLVTMFVELGLLAALAARRLRFVPDPRYLGAISAAAAAMVVAIVLLPGPDVLVAVLAIAVYASLLVAFPGPVRELGTRVVGDLRAAR